MSLERLCPGGYSPLIALGFAHRSGGLALWQVLRAVHFF